MLVALANDFVSASHHTHVLWDDRLGTFSSASAHTVSIDDFPDEQALLDHYARMVDWTIIIAPETDGVLAERCRWVESAGGRLLGCSSALTELLSDKHQTAEHLAVNEVPVPRGHTWEPGEPPPSLPCPVVVKPRDGAGSQKSFLVENTSALHELLDMIRRVGSNRKIYPGYAVQRIVPVRSAWLSAAARHVFRESDSSSTRVTGRKKVHACRRSNISAVVSRFRFTWLDEQLVLPTAR